MGVAFGTIGFFLPIGFFSNEVQKRCCSRLNGRVCPLVICYFTSSQLLLIVGIEEIMLYAHQYQDGYFVSSVGKQQETMDIVFFSDPQICRLKITMKICCLRRWSSARASIHVCAFNRIAFHCVISDTYRVLGMRRRLTLGSWPLAFGYRSLAILKP